MSGARFKSREEYLTGQSYRLLPFRFMRLDDGAILLVNEVGEYEIITAAAFDGFVSHTLTRRDDVYNNLKGKHFLCDSSSSLPLELLAIKYRTKKSHLAGFTKLHIFVVTLRCEHSCPYCQVSRVSCDRDRYDMTAETASRALDLVFSSPARTIKIEFQGGEPLLAFDRIIQIVEDAEARCAGTGRQIEFVVATNLALIDDQMLAYFRRHSVSVSTSLDGPEFIHDINRPRTEANSHHLAVVNIARARDALGAERVAALMTTTRLSLGYPQEIVDEYIRHGFTSIFIRPLSPYGFAVKTARSIGYTVEEFLSFYIKVLSYILQLNRKGVAFFESYARLLLTRILTPFSTGYVDLQSPAGTGIGAALYNYDGDVYVSDEARMLAEMGDKRFKLGNVHNQSYEELFGGQFLRDLVASSCIESIPGCADCVFQPYCGADPVFNYVTQGDLIGRRPDSEFHRKHLFLFRHLISLLEKDDETSRLLRAWVYNISPREALGL